MISVWRETNERQRSSELKQMTLRKTTEGNSCDLAWRWWSESVETDATRLGRSISLSVVLFARNGKSLIHVYPLFYVVVRTLTMVTR